MFHVQRHEILIHIPFQPVQQFFPAFPRNTDGYWFHSRPAAGICPAGINGRAAKSFQTAQKLRDVRVIHSSGIVQYPVNLRVIQVIGKAGFYQVIGVNLRPDSNQF